MSDPALVNTASKSELFRKLPSVDELLRTPELATLLAQESRSAVTDAARSVVDRLRQEISSGSLQPSGVDAAVAGLTAATERQLRRATAFSLRPVINATGVILHTNLGRAPLAQNALDHIRKISEGYSNLEFDLESGARGERDVHVDRLFRKLLPGADASPDNELSTIVVNNNAAAVWLALNTLAASGEVIVSRGELVEIGGSFRIPDVMTQSNGILREVGTTNRTRIRDYEQAINERTRLLLRVHRSNFQITGFTEQPPLEELVALARARAIPLVEDLGSGALLDLPSLGIRNEPGVTDSLRAGVDVVTYSGDKLLGGPQAGMLTGRADLVRRMRANSLFRALRVDKLTSAALEATLLGYVKGDHDAIPAVRMMRLSKDEIGRRADAVAQGLAGSAKLDVAVVDGESVIGGGAAPSAVLPTRLLAISGVSMNADEALARLRASDPPVIARVEEGRVVVDLRTVFPEQDALVLAAIRAISGSPNQP
ncbi:MAG TPA: L-seryl-tRNA(Sec) selenium transferase [Terriglobales bacterium]|jgi:L-seryl-tRNA(Ser) seleniumtransferase|nr:L-seryl-tRNA(Sec) selenium transferase [Terriglobales bacterium]